VRSLGAILVGIGAYRYSSSQFPLLQYAANDARKISQYVTTCWLGQSQVTTIRIDEEDATPDGVTAAFKTLQEKGPYDLQLIFLSGHGVVGGQSAGFLLQPPPGSSDISVLDYASLDRLLSSVTATQTVLILDCCSAEGIVRQMDFFTQLCESDARLFIASSRKQQLTWEDESLGHGIFTAHLLDFLNTGSSTTLNGVRDQLDVDSELFPALCAQVPLYVLEHKHQRQEPVKGGTSIRPVSLPVARAARRIKERSAFGTAIRRLRQITSGLALAGAVFLFLAYTLAYYAQADRNGNIQLRHGTKWLAPALRFVPTLRADTGIPTTDLSDDPANRYSIQAGENAGFWTQLSRQGYRTWYDTIRPSLDAKAATKYDVLIAANQTRPVYRLKEESLPSEVAFAAWALLDSVDSKQLATLFDHMLGRNLTSPLLSPFSANELDFDILDLNQPELASYADAMRAAAASDPDRAFVPYLGFLKATRMWLAHSSQ
jgi:hypothetical protein